MQLLDIRQNTPEWHVLRRTKIGASDCSGILSKNSFITPYRVWTQKTLGTEEKLNEDMQRGIKLEKEARDWVSQKHKIGYQDAVGQSDDRAWQIASLDCYYGDGHEIIAGEIKSPREKKLKEIKKNGIPEYWQWQMQHQMSVTGARRMFFLAYSQEEQYLTWINRNPEMIDYLNHMEEIFYFEYMVKFVPPPLSEREKIYQDNLQGVEKICS